MRLFDKLIEIKDEKLISFHVPGHKYNPIVIDYFSRLDSILDIDVTEFPGTDDLHDAEGCIEESQAYAAKLYNTKNSFFLVNGTTCGIYAMIMATTSPGDKIIVARDCHRAVYDAMILANIEATYIMPIIDEMTSIPLGITYEALKESIVKNPEVKAIVLTYPNYYGVACDLKSIVELAHSHNIPVLVDEAHGAHLHLSEALPPSSIECGADICVQSSHKSLPVLTQASMLHYNSDRVNLNRLKQMLNIHQTSSPSYVLMSSLDIALDIIGKKGQSLMSTLLKNCNELTEKHNCFLSTKDIENKPFSLDITKMVYKGKCMDVNPIDLEENLRKNGVQLEFSNENIALFVTSIMNDSTDFEYLSKTMEMLKFKCYSGIDNMAYALNLLCEMSISEAFYAQKETVLLKNAEGRISGDFIVPYPPGVPLIIPGEKINLQSISAIERMKKNNQKIVGMTNIEFEDLKIQVVTH